jgi:hypothetical protein
LVLNRVFARKVDQADGGEFEVREALGETPRDVVEFYVAIAG